MLDAGLKSSNLFHNRKRKTQLDPAIQDHMNLASDNLNKNILQGASRPVSQTSSIRSVLTPPPIPKTIKYRADPIFKNQSDSTI